MELYENKSTKKINLNAPYSMRNINNKAFEEEPIMLIKSKSYQNVISKSYKLESITDFNDIKDDSYLNELNKEERRRKREERKKNFDEFIKRNYAILERKKGLENRKNFLFEHKREIRSEQERIDGFNRLIDDANRRFEAKERAEQMLHDIKNSKKGNNKKYSSEEWKEIYNKRFIEFQKLHNEKILKEKQKKEEEIKKENEKYDKEIEGKKIKIPIKKINEITNKLYNKGRKIYNTKKDFTQSQSLKKNSSQGNKSFNKENDNNTVKNLKQNKSISKYKNIQPRYMQFFQTQSLEETLGKLRDERKEYENKINSKNSTLKEKEKDKDQSRISYSSNNSGLKIYQTNFIQCIKFKDFPSLNNITSENDNSNKKNNTNNKTSTLHYKEENKNLIDIEKIEEELMNDLNKKNKKY